MNMPDHLAAVLTKAKADGAQPAELAALGRRLRQLDEREAGQLPGEVLEPIPDLPSLDELPEPPPGQARKCSTGWRSSSSTAGWGRAWACRGRSR